MQQSGRQKRGVWQAETLRGRQKWKWSVFKGSLTRDFSLQVFFKSVPPGPLSVNSNPTVSEQNKKEIPVSIFSFIARVVDTSDQSLLSKWPLSESGN